MIVMVIMIMVGDDSNGDTAVNDRRHRDYNCTHSTDQNGNHENNHHSGKIDNSDINDNADNDGID